LYLFVSTKNGTVRDQCASLAAGNFHQILSRSDSNAGTYFFSAHPGPAPHYLWIVNDQRDYSIDDKIRALVEKVRPLPDAESFVNFADVSGSRFVAASGFWGLQHHYYHSDDETFICSNNVFIVASILGSRLSETSWFEYLFFNWPLNENTWFENIRALDPGQAVVFDWEARRLNVTPRPDLYSELTRSSGATDVAAEADAFFERVAPVLRERKAVIGLSAGSGSRTILAGLMKHKLLDHAASFGRDDFIETREIKRLTSKLRIKSVVYQTPGLFADWNASFYRGTLLTNGLLSPFRVHYVKYYGRIDGHAWFEGFLGSEFVKGVIAPGAMAAKSHLQVVRDGLKVRDVVNGNFGSLPAALRTTMDAYLSDAYAEVLKPITTPQGVRSFASFIFESDPSKCFGPLMILAGQKMKTYYPFLSPRLIRALGPQAGLLQHALRPRFADHLSCLLHEGRMVKRLDRKVYESRLDRLVSFKEALELPMPLLYPLWGLRRAQHKIATSRLHFGQTDFECAHGNARRFAEENAAVIQDDLLGDKLEGEALLKERCHLIGLRQIMGKSAKELIEYLTSTARP
jgi:hypothetical protein